MVAVRASGTMPGGAQGEELHPGARSTGAKKKGEPTGGSRRAAHSSERAQRHSRLNRAHQGAKALDGHVSCFK
jgi:hypothetical protein